MGTVKIAILEKDGVEYDTSVEMDLIAALDFVGFTGTPFDIDKILTGDEGQVLSNQYGNVIVRD